MMLTLAVCSPPDDFDDTFVALVRPTVSEVQLSRKKLRTVYGKAFHMLAEDAGSREELLQFLHKHQWLPAHTLSWISVPVIRQLQKWSEDQQSR